MKYYFCLSHKLISYSSTPILTSELFQKVVLFREFTLSAFDQGILILSRQPVMHYHTSNCKGNSTAFMRFEKITVRLYLKKSEHKIDKSRKSKQRQKLLFKVVSC